MYGYPMEHLSYTTMAMIARTEGDPMAIVEAARRIVQRIDAT